MNFFWGGGSTFFPHIEKYYTYKKSCTPQAHPIKRIISTFKFQYDSHHSEKYYTMLQYSNSSRFIFFFVTRVKVMWKSSKKNSNVEIS